MTGATCAQETVSLVVWTRLPLGNVVQRIGRARFVQFHQYGVTGNMTSCGNEMAIHFFFVMTYVCLLKRLRLASSTSCKASTPTNV